MTRKWVEYTYTFLVFSYQILTHACLFFLFWCLDWNREKIVTSPLYSQHCLKSISLNLETYRWVKGLCFEPHTRRKYRINPTLCTLCCSVQSGCPSSVGPGRTWEQQCSKSWAVPGSECWRVMVFYHVLSVKVQDVANHGSWVIVLDHCRHCNLFWIPNILTHPR